MNRYDLPSRLSARIHENIDVGGGAGTAERRCRCLPTPGNLVAGNTIAWQAPVVLFSVDTPNYRYYNGLHITNTKRGDL